MRTTIVIIVAFLLGVGSVMIGLTQYLLPTQATQVTVSAHIPANTQYTVIPAGALQTHPGLARVQIKGGNIFAAYGTTANVTAWLHSLPYTAVAFTAGGRGVVTKHVAPAITTIIADTATDPAIADLWLATRQGSGSLTWALNLPADTSVIIAAADGSATPSSVNVTWPTQPVDYLPTLLLGGGLGLALALLGVAVVNLVRRYRRRTTRTRQQSRPSGRRGRAAGATAALLVAPLAIFGIGATPANAASNPSPQASLTDMQATHILTEVSTVSAKADDEHDTKLLSTRVTGPALALRETVYTLATIKKLKTLTPLIKTENSSVRLILSQATNAWPRTLFAVLSDTATSGETAPQALTLRQDTPRGLYKLVSAVDLQPGASLPSLPNSTHGATELNPTTMALTLTPNQLATTYGTLLRKAKPDSAMADLFDTTDDGLYENVGPAAKKTLAKNLGKTAKITYSNPATYTTDTAAWATAGSEALISVYLSEVYTITPAMIGVTIKPSGDTKRLAKVAKTDRGIQATYGYQLLFTVPAAGDTGKIKLLGYTGGLVGAAEIPKKQLKN